MNYLSEIAQSIREEVPPDSVPDDSEDLFVLYAVLALAKGGMVTAEDVHNAWSAWMVMKGKEHESIVPYRDLPADTRQEDEPYVMAIRRVADQLSER